MRASPGLIAAAILTTLVTAASCERTPATVAPDPSGEAESEAADAGDEVDDTAPTRDGEHVMRYDDRDIYVYADPELGREVERLFLLFEDLRAEAVPLSTSTRLPIGWTTLSFVVEDGRLIVEEPDYDNEPESHTRRDISVSLSTLARQRAVLERVGIQGEAINFDQHVLTIRGVLDRDEIMMVRVESPGGRMTGWRMTPAEGIAEADEIESLPVYAILSQRPELLDAMLLPAGYLALYSGPQITTIVNERNEIVWDWSVDGELPRDRAEDLGSAIGGHEPRERAKPLLDPI